MVGVAAVSTAAVWVKLCSAPALAVASWRLVLAASLFWAWRLLRGRSGMPRLSPRELRLGALAGIFLGLHFACWIASLGWTSVASSVVLVTTNPLWVGLASWLWLKEPPPRAFWQGLALALAGAGLVGLGEGRGGPAAPDPWTGNLLALAGAWMASVYLLIGRAVQSHGEQPHGAARGGALGYVTWVYSAAAVTLLILSLAAGVPLGGAALEDWAPLLGLALVPQALGHTLLHRALGQLPASEVAVALLGEPAGAILLAWLLFGEAPGGLQLLGAGLILLGVARSQRGPT